MSNRAVGFDLIRTSAILCIFIYHIVNRQASNPSALLLVNTLVMVSLALLGFISARLLSVADIQWGPFLIKRLTRIYIPLILCLTAILALQAVLGMSQIGQQVLLHFMGLTAFFKLLGVASSATIGFGLWFITVIVGLYLFLPALKTLLEHRNGLWHLFGIIAVCTGLDSVMWGTENIWTVVTAFALGMYANISPWFARWDEEPTAYFLAASAALLCVIAWAISSDAPRALPHVLSALSPVVLCPLFFRLASVLPRPTVSASAFFAGVSYEFYILHFYFINEGFGVFFRIDVGMGGQMLISFIAVLLLSFFISRAAFKIRTSVVTYLVN